MEKREATWFLIYSNLQTGVCVQRLQKACALRSAFGGVATLETLPYFLCAHALTHTHTLLKCALHSCQWLYNSWCVSVKSVHCPVCAQSMKSPVTCNNLLPELFIVPLLESDNSGIPTEGLHDLAKRLVIKLLWTILAFAIVIASIKRNS